MTGVYTVRYHLVHQKHFTVYTVLLKLAIKWTLQSIILLFFTPASTTDVQCKQFYYIIYFGTTYIKITTTKKAVLTLSM